MERKRLYISGMREEEDDGDDDMLLSVVADILYQLKVVIGFIRRDGVVFYCSG